MKHPNQHPNMDGGTHSIKRANLSNQSACSHASTTWNVLHAKDYRGKGG